MHPSRQLLFAAFDVSHPPDGPWFVGLSVDTVSRPRSSAICATRPPLVHTNIYPPT